MTPMLYIIGTTLSVAFILVGWNAEGYIHQLCLILGGVYLGHIITEALNHDETKPNNTTKNQGRANKC